jgi:hypothetical protein
MDRRAEAATVRDCKWIAAQRDQSDEPLDCSLAVSVESEELGDIPYGCSVGLDLPALAVTLARSAWAGGCQIASGVPLKSSARSTLMSTPKPSFSGSPFFSGSMSRLQISSYIGPDL